MAGPERVTYGDDPSQFFDRWSAAGKAVGTAVLIHGGYWRDRYGLDLMDPMATHLQAAGWSVINLEYRRLPTPDGSAPDGVWAEMSADVLTGTDAGLAMAAEAVEAAANHSTVVIGHSAGGQLGLWLAKVMAERHSTVEQKGHRGFDLVVALAPVSDLIEADRLQLSDGAATLLLGGDQTEVPDRYLAASPAAKLPLGAKQLVIHGRDDTNVPNAMSVKYAEAATAAGDDIELIDLTSLDHFDIINPAHWIWRAVDRRLARLSDR